MSFNTHFTYVVLFISYLYKLSLAVINKYKLVP